jgi:hypothetical protein
MQNTTLQLGQILQLETEVNGVVNTQTGETISKGLLKEVLKFKTKYWLMQLSDDLVAEKKKIEAVRDQLVKELGEEDETGAISLPVFINEVQDEDGKVVSREVNPKFLDFQEKFNELLAETKELSHGKFLLEDFEAVESAEVYPVFFKLISAE